MITPRPLRPHRRLAWTLSLSSALALGLWATDADASGLSTARFGGEHGHPTTENPSAIYYNPGAIALSKGTHIMVDGLIALRKVTYERPASAVSTQNGAENGANYSTEYFDGANNGTASLFNVAGAPFVAVTSDFGTDLVYAGVGAYVPFGGGATWSKNKAFAGNEDAPGAVDGVQRWYAIDGSIRSLYITGALAFKIKAAKMTIGASGSAIYTSFDTIRARNTNGTDNLVTGQPGDFQLAEGRSWLEASGWQGGFAVGMTAEPIDDVLWIGASYTSQPNVTGGMRLEGTLTNIFGTTRVNDVVDTKIFLDQSFPDIVRLGFRVRPIPNFELRVFADYTRWSVMDKQCVMEVPNKNPGPGLEPDPDPKCNFENADKALEDPASFGADIGNGPTDNTVGVTQHLPRFWKDAGGIRIGAGYWFLEELEAYIGLGYDSSAVPVETVDPALFDMDKISVTAGALWQAHEHVAIGATIGQIIYFPLDTKGRNVLNKFQSPTRQASADGVYKQYLTLGNLYLDISF